MLYYSAATIAHDALDFWPELVSQQCRVLQPCRPSTIRIASVLKAFSVFLDASCESSLNVEVADKWAADGLQSATAHPHSALLKVSLYARPNVDNQLIILCIWQIRN